MKDWKNNEASIARDVVDSRSATSGGAKVPYN